MIITVSAQEQTTKKLQTYHVCIKLLKYGHLYYVTLFVFFEKTSHENEHVVTSSVVLVGLWV